MAVTRPPTATAAQDGVRADTRTRTRAHRRLAFVRATHRHRIARTAVLPTARSNPTGGERAVAVRTRRRRRVRAFFDRRRVGRHHSGGSDNGNSGVVASRTTPSSGA